MNVKRIAIGGILAAVVLMLGEGITEAVFGSVHVRWLAQMGLPTPGEAVMALFAVMAVAIGALMVWLYAAICPRYGAGPRTAILVGLAVWALNCLAPNVALWSLGAFPTGLFVYATMHDLVVVPLAALAGAYLYREKAEPVLSAAAPTSPTGG